MLMLLLFATTIAVGAVFTLVRRKRKAQPGAAD
jgi:hypothetical protein